MRDIKFKFANLGLNKVAWHPPGRPNQVYVDRSHWRSLNMQKRLDLARELLRPVIEHQMKENRDER